MYKHLSLNEPRTPSTAEASIRITVDSITDKGSHKLNEDALVANTGTGIFAVFDGAAT